MVQHLRITVAGATLLVVAAAASGGAWAPPVRAWFPSGTNQGHEFIYN
jgi:hypothetical protein